MTISVPSSSATCRFFSSSRANFVTLVCRESGLVRPLRSHHRTQCQPGSETARPPAPAQPGPDPRFPRLASKRPCAPGSPAAARRGCRASRSASARRSSGPSSRSAAARGRRAAARASGPRGASGRPSRRAARGPALEAVEDGAGERLRLVDRRDRLRLEADLLAAAVELGRVDRAGEDQRDVDRRIPCSSSSTRADSKNVRAAAFDEQYAAWSGIPR